LIPTLDANIKWEKTVPRFFFERKSDNPQLSVRKMF
jgi:hypothetical protein